VSAKDLGTGKEAKVSITGSTTLSKEDVERMVREAELHAEEDRRRRELIELRNRAESLAYQTERMLDEYGDRIPAEEKNVAQTAIQNVRALLSSEDFDALRRATETLDQAARRAGEAIYRAASSSVAEQPTVSSEPDGESGESL